MDSKPANADPLSRFLLTEAHTRGAIIRGTNIIAEAARVHGLSTPVAGLFGQVLLSSILLLSISKGGTRQVLQLDAVPASAHAPIRRMLAETGQGRVRGYIQWREDEPAMHAPHGPELSAWMGNPVRLSTVRDLGFGQPYVSTIEHDSDFLADHLVHYLCQSVQTRADIVLHGDLAMMIEAMPGCDEERWFAAVKAMAAIPASALENETTDALLHRFDALGCKQVEQVDYAYACHCSLEKMQQALNAMDAEALRGLADEQGRIRISCQYCERFYELELPDA